MDKNSFSVSFVGVMVKPLDVLPVMDNKFAKDLFELPYDTFNGITPEGYIIAIENKPFPMVIVNPEKLIIKAKDMDSLVVYLNKIKAEFDRMSVKFAFSSFGINSEYQWVNIGSSAETWLWDHFMKRTFVLDAPFHLCSKLNLRVGINDTQLVNLEIEPRRGVRDGIFANINHHHNQPLDVIPTGDYAISLISESMKIINDRIIKTLIENE